MKHDRDLLSNLTFLCFHSDSKSHRCPELDDFHSTLFASRMKSWTVRMWSVWPQRIQVNGIVQCLYWSFEGNRSHFVAAPFLTVATTKRPLLTLILMSKCEEDFTKPSPLLIWHAARIVLPGTGEHIRDCEERGKVRGFHIRIYTQTP